MFSGDSFKTVWYALGGFLVLTLIAVILKIVKGLPGHTRAFARRLVWSMFKDISVMNLFVHDALQSVMLQKLN